MRHGGAAKQCVWLGPGRYRGRCRDAVTNPEPDSYTDSNRYTFCMRAGVTNTHGNCDRDSHSNCYCHANSDSYGNGYTDADVDTYAEACSNTKASANAAASPVVRLITRREIALTPKAFGS